MNYGYVRVSTKEQNEDRQVMAMIDIGIDRNNIIIEKHSGKDFERPLYKKLLLLLKKGDVLYIKSLDRLGRNYKLLKDEWRHITEDLNVDIVIIDMPMLDTRLYKDLLGTFISDMFISVLSFFAENEREYIRLRQAEGIAAAKSKGKHLGRPRNPLPDEFEVAKRLWLSKSLNLEQAANYCNMSKSSFHRAVKNQEKDVFDL